MLTLAMFAAGAAHTAISLSTIAEYTAAAGTLLAALQPFADIACRGNDCEYDDEFEDDEYDDEYDDEFDDDEDD